MDQKALLIEGIVSSLKEIVLSTDEVVKDLEQIDFDELASVSEFESDNRSEVTRSAVGSQESGAGKNPL